MRTERRASLVDVAKLAGVSQITVSRVVNSPALVKAETRERVERAIMTLGYRRNTTASALKTQRSSSIGLVLAGSRLFELPNTLLGVETAAKEHGLTVSLASWQGGSAEDLAEAFARLEDQYVRGIAVIADRTAAEEQLRLLTPAAPTTVITSGTIEGAHGLGFIEYDHVHGARLAVRHLMSLGHRTVTHITGNLQTLDARDRAEGWRRELADHGIDDGEMLEGNFEGTSGYSWAMRLANRPEGLPTAIFTGNDEMAMGVLAAFAELGVRVPEDVSVVGYDDLAGTQYLIPALTTVRQSFELLGREAVAQLLTAVAGEPPRVTQLLPELITRRSAAAPRPQ